MIPAIRLLDEQHFLRAWQRFVNMGELMPNVPAPIARSWFRCRNRKLNPHQVYYQKHPNLDPQNFLSINQQLVIVFREVLAELQHFLAAGDLLLAVTDHQGTVLDWIGNPGILPANVLGAGHLLTEEVTGTMATGLAIIEQEPFQVRGPEHYCSFYHQLTSLAIPFFRTGKIYGALGFWTLEQNPASVGAVGILAARLIQLKLNKGEQIPVISSELTLAEAEQKIIVKVLAENGYNVSRTAQTLGISRNTLYNKIKKYGLQLKPEEVS